MSGVGLAAILAPLVMVSGTRAKAEWRIDTPAGPVRVFRPTGYDAKYAAVVVYVHGLYNDLDSAWTEHALAAQFEASNRHAIFIAPEAPVAAQDPVRFKDLGALLELVDAKLPGVLPADAPIVAVGHSGAYRTIVEWLGEPRLHEVILIDGMYGEVDAYAEWLSAATEPPHRMVLTILTTKKWASALLERFPDAVSLPHIPKWTWPEHAHGAQLVAITSQRFGHMEQITDQKTLPIVLRLTRLARRWNPK